MTVGRSDDSQERRLRLKNAHLRSEYIKQIKTVIVNMDRMLDYVTRMIARIQDCMQGSISESQRQYLQFHIDVMRTMCDDNLELIAYIIRSL
jgi:predicted transcriptional regulator